MSELDFDITKVEFTPYNLSHAGNKWMAYKSFCEGVAGTATNGHLQPRVAGCHWVDFDNLTAGNYRKIPDPIDCNFGEIWGGGAFMEDGTPFHAVVCEHCLAFKYTGSTAVKVKGYGILGKLFRRFR